MVLLAKALKKTGFLFLLFILFTSNLIAQKTRTESGSAQIRIEGNMTEEQAKRKVEELARINAIQNAFGSYVEQQAIGRAHV